jgi:hypothetical protein
LSDFDISVGCDLTAFIVLPSAIFMLAMLSIVIVEAIVRGAFRQRLGVSGNKICYHALSTPLFRA